jgi:hypothetical protein
MIDHVFSFKGIDCVMDRNFRSITGTRIERSWIFLVQHTNQIRLEQ